MKKSSTDILTLCLVGRYNSKLCVPRQRKRENNEAYIFVELAKTQVGGYPTV